MSNFSISIEIAASPDQVWTVLRDIERWPEWTPTITSLQRVTPGPLAVGSRVYIRQPKLRPAEWRVTELEEGRGFTWVTRSPGVRVTAGHWAAAHADGSQVTLSLEFVGLLGPLVARLARGLLARYVALEAKGLKERSERLAAAARADQ